MAAGAGTLPPCNCHSGFHILRDVPSHTARNRQACMQGDGPLNLMHFGPVGAGNRTHGHFYLCIVNEPDAAQRGGPKHPIEFAVPINVFGAPSFTLQPNVRMVYCDVQLATITQLSRINRPADWVDFKNNLTHQFNVYMTEGRNLAPAIDFDSPDSEHYSVAPARANTVRFYAVGVWTDKSEWLISGPIYFHKRLLGGAKPRRDETLESLTQSEASTTDAASTHDPSESGSSKPGKKRAAARPVGAGAGAGAGGRGAMVGGFPVSVVVSIATPTPMVTDGRPAPSYPANFAPPPSPMYDVNDARFPPALITELITPTAMEGTLQGVATPMAFDTYFNGLIDIPATPGDTEGFFKYRALPEYTPFDAGEGAGAGAQPQVQFTYGATPTQPGAGASTEPPTDSSGDDGRSSRGQKRRRGDGGGGDDGDDDDDEEYDQYLGIDWLGPTAPEHATAGTPFLFVQTAPVAPNRRYEWITVAINAHHVGRILRDPATGGAEIICYEAGLCQVTASRRARPDVSRMIVILPPGYEGPLPTNEQGATDIDMDQFFMFGNHGGFVSEGGPSFGGGGGDGGSGGGAGAGAGSGPDFMQYSLGPDAAILAALGLTTDSQRRAGNNTYLVYIANAGLYKRAGEAAAKEALTATAVVLPGLLPGSHRNSKTTSPTKRSRSNSNAQTPGAGEAVAATPAVAGSAAATPAYVNENTVDDRLQGEDVTSCAPLKDTLKGNYMDYPIGEAALKGICKHPSHASTGGLTTVQAHYTCATESCHTKLDLAPARTMTRKQVQDKEEFCSSCRKTAPPTVGYDCVEAGHEKMLEVILNEPFVEKSGLKCSNCSKPHPTLLWLPCGCYVGVGADRACLQSIMHDGFQRVHANPETNRIVFLCRLGANSPALMHEASLESRFSLKLLVDVTNAGENLAATVAKVIDDPNKNMAALYKYMKEKNEYLRYCLNESEQRVNTLVSTGRRSSLPPPSLTTTPTAGGYLSSAQLPTLLEVSPSSKSDTDNAFTKSAQAGGDGTPDSAKAQEFNSTNNMTSSMPTAR